MKKFVAIYLGSAEGLAEWNATDDEERKKREKAGMEGWLKWAKDNETSIVDLGSPLGKTKRIDAKGVSDCQERNHGIYDCPGRIARSCRKTICKSSAFYDLPGPVGRSHGMSAAPQNVNGKLGQLHASR